MTSLSAGPNYPADDSQKLVATLSCYTHFAYVWHSPLLPVSLRMLAQLADVFPNYLDLALC